ncbi:Histone H2A.Z-specific chaperone CHZ1 [Vermiconidia calcicola]|uniref:Histone H2A.Z-specific chaperone CHZ1 n=1 Tax=Vermiconidia calcicola TaxID=1690605 RepID=A0ACC3NND6_9PEZI|nr:Histone H2A.Z-specific chaperone CHZ1 [Vermiconidia calcicola]
MSSNGIQEPNSTEQMSMDTPMDSPEKLEKGKGKVAAMTEDPMDDDDDESAEDTEAEGEPEVEEADEDNMEEIDTENIVSSRTRGKNIDYAQAAKELEDDEDDEDDDDFQDDDMMED